MMREASGAGQGGPSDRRQGWPGAGVPGAADVSARHGAGQADGESEPRLGCGIAHSSPCLTAGSE